MRHSVENHRIRISVDQVGAELFSLINLDSGKEYMWQADPDIWGGHAPVLFPIIGKLKDGTTEIDGKQYAITKHGIVRNNEDLELYSHSEDRITFRLCSSEKTKKQYPYDFDFRITYRVRNAHVIVYHEIQNMSTEPMYFCLGGHPAFRVPLHDHDPYDAHFLRFEHDETSASHIVKEDGTLREVTRPVPWTEGNILPLSHELFDNDALVFRDLNSRSVVLESKINGPLLKVDYAGWTHLGIWAKPNGDFVCIEPWMGLADFEDSDGAFKHKEGIIELAGNETYVMSFDIKVL
ncbi:MAG: galactose mutarotase-like enzyme [Neolewinella sp.]|jgi:galactose mutarotase-like enzyme